MKTKHEIILDLLVASGAVSQETVDKYAACLGQVGPLRDKKVHRGEKPYIMRQENPHMSWREIGEHTGVSSSNIWVAARGYARRNNLPWPI